MLLEKRCIGANKAPFLNKTPSKEIMARSRVRNKYMKYRTIDNKIADDNQRELLCLSIS